MDLEAPHPRGGSRRGAWASVGSFVVLAASLGIFAWWWIRFGRAPVLRSSEMVGPLYSFLEFWTRVFLLAALAGSFLGILGIKRNRSLGLLAIFGNVTWLSALFVLRMTA